MEAAGYKTAAWVKEMLAGGATSFYKVRERRKTCVFTSKKELCFCSNRRPGRFYCNAEL